MAIERDNPYGAFNFQVEVTGNALGDAKTIKGGFQEVSGLSLEVAVAEYRTGNDPNNHTRKMLGLTKSGDVTLKRGVMGVVNFYTWLKEASDGKDASVRRTVTLNLLDEAHQGPVMTWKLFNARPMKYTGPTLNAKGGTDVAIEELVLACERIEIN